ncbi:SDR family NAD(P)-dependent oxidoreductase [Actinoplanes sp. RD1]|uniref:SDR family NAD(P)-dependent oxidoreductase n=1 Tax=Actinoplanes sp. RD1 TaxID=3064538 RepID=UPI0027417CDF|nr:SDR family oxidoreductase [Actinoplanes sp. RD1]
MGTLDGTTSLVTGASRGLGRAIARKLAAEGSLVAVHYGTNEPAAQDVVARITEAGGAAFAVGARLGVAGDAERLWAAMDTALAERGARPGVDVLVNNAGIGGATPNLSDARPDDFDELFAINVKAPFFVVQRGLDRLRDGGRIVNISSLSSRIATPDVLAYAMTKGAINIFSTTLAQELGSRGITVNAVLPGVTATEANVAWFAAQPAIRDIVAGMSALRRVGEPADVADVVAFLASPAARWVTGQVIDATGGAFLGLSVGGAPPAA